MPEIADIFENLERNHGVYIEPKDRTRPIGKGGLAIVYRGVIRALKDRKAAVKISRDAIADEPELLKKELDSLDRLLQGPLGSAPNIVSMLAAPILELDHDEQTYLVTVWELADRSLHDLQRRQFPQGLSREDALHFYEDVARGLDDMAREGEVHRDMKPGNVLLFGNRAKLADVGLMRVLANRTEKTTAIRGTLETMPPESMNQSNLVVSPTFDSYSFGASYAITRRGRPLFADEVGSSAMVDLSMIKRLLTLKSEFHRVDLSGLDPDEQALVRQLCDPDPKQRPMGHLADLIRALRSTSTNSAASFSPRPGTPGDQLRRCPVGGEGPLQTGSNNDRPSPLAPLPGVPGRGGGSSCDHACLRASV